MSMIFDTHAHYDDEAFGQDREELLSGLQEHGIEAVVNISANIQGVKDTLELMRQYPFFYGAVGVHPSETREWADILAGRDGQKAKGGGSGRDWTGLSLGRAGERITEILVCPSALPGQNSIPASSNPQP